MSGLAHKTELNEETGTYCIECGARHSVGADLAPEERGCMCGGDLKLTRSMGRDELEKYAFEWGVMQ